MFGSTGNLLLQNGGTFTDAGYRLDVNGTARILNTLTSNADIIATTNFTSSSNNIILSDNAGVVFRGVRVNSWSDSVSSRFFQIGTSADNITFTTQSGTAANRMLFSSLQTQISTGNYIGHRVAAGIFEVCNNTTAFLNVFGTGNVTINNTVDSGYRLDVNGTTRLQSTLTLGSVPTTSASTYDVLTRNTSTGVVEKVSNIIPIQLKDFYVDVNNVGIVETDLLTYTTLANRLNAIGEKIVASYAGTFNDATASSQLKVVFGTTVIGDTGALTMSIAGAWIINTSIMRTGATTARSMVNISTPGASTASYTKYTSLAGLTFSNSNIIKITGTASGATGGDNDITASYGNILWQPAAV